MSGVTRRSAAWRIVSFTLTNAVVAVKGKMACLDTSTGKVTKGGTSTTLIPIGTFEENLTGTGSNEVSVRLSREIELLEWKNDSNPNAVAATHVGSSCYIKDDETVSSSSASSTRSVCGMVLAVRSTGVLVLHGFGAAGATGQSGDAGAFESEVDLNGGCLAAGTALAAFADGASATPGLALDNSKAAGVRWNNHATPAAVYRTIPLPADLDDASALTVEILASKTGATLGDATKFTIGAFFQTVGALRDADADAGGDTDAMTGNAATKTLQRVTLTIAAGDVPAAPCALTLSVKPKDGTLGTDDVTIHSIKIMGQRTLA